MQATVLKQLGPVLARLFISCRANFTSCRIWFSSLLPMGQSWWEGPFSGFTSAFSSFSVEENGIFLCYNNLEDNLDDNYVLDLCVGAKCAGCQQNYQNNFYPCFCQLPAQSPRSCLHFSEYKNYQGHIRRSPPWPPGHLSPPGQRRPRRSWLEIKARKMNVWGFCAVKPDMRTHRSLAGTLPWTEGCP